MNHSLFIEETPNPNAKKFILDFDVVSDGRKVTYRSPQECLNNPLASAIFDISSVSALHFFENVITVTVFDWSDDELIRETILNHIEEHDPKLVLNNSQKVEEKYSDENLKKIDAILNKTIRPSLVLDGGDLTILKLDGNILYIHYEGACGGCPSAEFGTLQAIEGILKSEYNENVEVRSV